MIKHTPAEQHIFSVIQTCADTLQCNVYAVGGYVRDKIIQRDSKDIDVLCDKNGVELAKLVAKELENAPVSIFATYGTAMVKYRDFEIEFVGARKESYAPESRNPQVVEGTFEDDIARRDFTINALAYNLKTFEIIDLSSRFTKIKQVVLTDITGKILLQRVSPVVNANFLHNGNYYLTIKTEAGLYTYKCIRL